jgi:hypothetical protein
MAVFKALRQKEKVYVFKVFGNEKSSSPATAVFSRFPLQDELFPVASQKNIMESAVIKNFDNSLEAREQLVNHIVNVMIENMTANRFDYITFVKECIDRFEDFFYGDTMIKTVDEFLSLPPEAVQKIAKDLYLYSKVEDEFTMGE